MPRLQECRPSAVGPAGRRFRRQTGSGRVGRSRGPRDEVGGRHCSFPSSTPAPFRDIFGTWLLLVSARQKQNPAFAGQLASRRGDSNPGPLHYEDLEVLSNGRLDEWGKTEHSTQRRTVIPSLLDQDLAEWRKTLEDSGHPAGALDFIIPGDLAGPEHGARDPRTGTCHFSENQARAWGERFFHPRRRESSRAAGTLRDPRRDPLLAAPRRHLPAPARRGPPNRRQRVRHQPTHAQHPLCLRDRGPPPQRTTPS
jgi:hypothetical protein